MENSIEKEEEILNNIKAYMQENIDKGYHKFVYNDLGYDEKCVDVINAIDHILSDYKRVLKENEELKNGTRRNEDELEVSIDGDWDALKKALDEAEKTNEYIIYDNGKWIKEKYCVPIQKVKDKIEDLYKEDRKWTEELSEPDSNFKNIDRNLKRIKNQTEVLKGLLESEEN